MLTSTALLAIVLLLLVVIYYLFLRHPRPPGNYPPGPRPIPFFGNLFQIDKLAPYTHDAFSVMARRYGPMFSIWFVRTPAIVISDYKLIRQAFAELNISGRPDIAAFNFHAGGKNGVLCADGAVWNEQRRFTLRHLRDFGFGKQNMEAKIMDEVQELIETFKKREGEPVEPKSHFSLAILNALWIITTGNRFSHSDPEVLAILREFFDQINIITDSGLLSFVPAIAKLAPEMSGWNNLMRAVNKTIELFEKSIREHEQSRIGGSPRDFIDSYLDEIEKTEEKGSSFRKETGRQQLVAVIGDLFAAGAETTATTLHWSVLYLAKHPDVARTFQEEIDAVIGRSRMPSLADKPKMPYTEALMYEIFRKSSIVALGLFHTPMTDVKFNGYDIPKDTLIVPNLYHVHNNVETWGDPENFRPERFLSRDDGGALVVQKHEALMPFSTGKRQCLGETLARDEFFLFLTSIYQRFDIELDEASKDVTLSPMKTFLLSPHKYHVIMTDRRQQ